MSAGILSQGPAAGILGQGPLDILVGASDAISVNMIYTVNAEPMTCGLHRSLLFPYVAAQEASLLAE